MKGKFPFALINPNCNKLGCTVRNDNVIYIKRREGKGGEVPCPSAQTRLPSFPFWKMEF